jgi:hypothetical protein
MTGGRWSGVGLAAVFGLLALAPAPAVAAGARFTPGADAVGAAPGRPTLGVPGTNGSAQRMPVRRAAAALASRPATAEAPGATPPPGIGPNVPVSPTTNADRFSSTAVAVDPNDTTGRHLAAASNFTTGAGFETYASADGGATWSSAPVVAAAPVVFAAEPGVAFDTAGTGGNHTFYSFIGFDQQSNSQLEVARRNPDNSVGLSVLDGFANEPGFPMIAADPRSGNGSVYVAYEDNPPAAGTGEPIMVAASHDDGQTWGKPVQVWNSGGEYAARPGVGPDGTIYVVWDDFCGLTPAQVPTATACPKLSGQILLSRSTDGGATWSSTPTHIHDTFVGTGSILTNYGTECTQGCATRAVGTVPQIAIDSSGGPRNGTIYVIYGDFSDRQIGGSTVANPAHPMVIAMQESKDGGTTWSSLPVVIGSMSNRYAWEPSVAVDQSNGNVVASWYDRIDDGSDHLYRAYFSESLTDSNGRAQFTATLPVADAQSDPQVDCNGSGDYQQIVAANGTAHPVWTDTRSGLPAIFTSAIDETTASTSTSTPGTGSSPLRPSQGSAWIGLPGGGTDIGVGANCEAWIIGENAVTGGGQTWVWGGSSRGWLPSTGGGVRITVHVIGLPRLVNSSGGIFRLQPGGSWQQLPGGGTDISSGADGSLWLIGLDGETGGHGVWVFNGTGWTFMNGGGVRIAVGPDGLPWVVNQYGQVWHLDANGWHQVPGGAHDIAVGADGSVWILGLNAVGGGWQTYRLRPDLASWDAVNGGGVAIAAGPDGMPWVVNSAGQIFERA